MGNESRVLDDQTNREAESREDPPLSPSVDALNLEDLGFGMLYDNDK